MNKDEFMNEIKKALGKISEAESADILYDYEEHFMIGKENGKTEEEICLELGDPKEIAKNYLLNHTNESIQDDIKEGKEKNSSFVSSGNNNRNVILIAGLIMAFLLIFAAGFVERARYNFVNSHKVEAGGIRIDSSGIHGDGISIDSNGVKLPGISVDSDGVKTPGVRVDGNGVKVPGVNIDNNGVKTSGVNIDYNGIKVNVSNEK